MRRRLIHPWWVHLPAAGVLAGFVGFALSGVDRWPARIPIRTGWSGAPTAWGSPWISFGLILGLGMLFLVLSTWLDELWARQEERKRFNPLSILDEVVIGAMVGIQGGFTVSWADATHPFPWIPAVALFAGTVLAGVWLETRRPFVPKPESSGELAADAFIDALRDRARRGERIVYWDVQNPAYIAWLSIGLPFVFWGTAASLWTTQPWATGVYAAIGCLLLVLYGGQRTCVTNDRVTIRYGWVGLRVFRSETHRIVGISVRTFSALREFGGYGIRFGRSTVGYFLCGSRGVEIAVEGRRAILIGSSHPERLAGVLRVVSGLDGAGEREKELE